MVKVKNKTTFKKSLRDPQPPVLERPYEPPEVKPAVFKRAEEACKELASSDEVVRDQAMLDVKTMLEWIESGDHNLDVPLEFAKLWKGLFYCMWHSDKPLVQLACAERIADLVMQLSSWKHRAEWMAQGWACMTREWGLIDKWRVDKYYSLMRRMFNRQLRCQIAAAEELGDTDEFDVAVQCFCEPLVQTYENRLSGVGSHITDVFVEECADVNLSPDGLLALFHQLLLPILMTSTEDHCERIYDFIWTKLLGGYREDEDMLEWMAEIPWEDLLPSLQTAALDEATKDQNRGLLNKMCEELEAFMDQADDYQEFVEIDSEEEDMDERLKTRRALELSRREQADTEAKRMKDVKQKRMVARKLKKAQDKGDAKAVKGLLKTAKDSGIVIPKMKKKKKGKGGLAKAVGLDPANLAKGTKKRHRKRRV